MTLTAVARLPPSGVSRYSTVTGTVGYTVRVTRFEVSDYGPLFGR